MKDVQTMLGMEEYAEDMGQHVILVVMTDVRTNPSGKGYVSDMVRRYQSVVMMDATTML